MIDSRASVDPKAELAADVHVGPWTVIGPGVEIESGCRIGPHAVVQGPTRIGPDNRIHPFCVIGGDPQDKKYAGEEARLEIGRGNVFREYTTVNRGTGAGGGVTRVGDDNWIMAYCHIAHDCTVGSHTIFANNATLAGHVEVEDWAILGGFTGVHQFTSVGAHSFAGMGSMIGKDVPPYVMVSGNMARAHGINVEGLRRRGFDDAVIRRLRQAYKVLYRQKLTLAEAVERLAEMVPECPEVEPMVRFLRASTRGIVR